MKHSKIYIILLVAISLAACSTKKNTFVRRNYHAMTAKYNVYFNANEAYKEGTEKFRNTVNEDYSRVLPVFYFSVHEFAPICLPQMETAITKSKKLIQKHSIRKKPKRNRRKAKNPNYKKWYASEEFNVIVDDAYILLGKATFHKMEFLDALGIFNYASVHFRNLPEAYLAKVWMARCYAEMDWLYEAEDLLKKINDENFPERFQAQYTSTYADVMLKMSHFDEAVPYLKSAIEHEKDRDSRIRYKFILAQLAQDAGRTQEATRYYKEVIKANPDYTMSFNAKIRLTEVYQGDGNSDGIRKMLTRMLRDDKNLDYYDQIYYALANVELSEDNIEKAIEYYQLSLENNKGNKTQRGITLLTLGDLKYKTGKYMEAQPYYTEAVSALGEEYPGIARVKELVNVLEDLNSYFAVIEHEDSLQQLAMLPEEDLLSKIDEVIAYEKANPQVEVSPIPQMPQQDVNSTFGNLPGGGGNAATTWYFYNPSLVQKGAAEFKRIWGNRQLTDNWRIGGKGVKKEATEGLANNTVEEDTLSADDLRNKYLANIPLTEATLKRSNDNIALALFGVGNIFRDNLQDYPEAISYYNELLERFPESRNVVDTYFGKYRAFTELGEEDNADEMKQKLIEEFPNSRYAVILSDPDYLTKLEAAKAKQDSLYQTAYTAFLDGNFNTVNHISKEMYEKYPDAEVRPNMQFLEAFVTGKTGSVMKFREQLTSLISDYPNAEVTDYAKEILAMLDEGNIPEGGMSSIGTLLSKRDQSAQSETAYDIISDTKSASGETAEQQPIYSIDLTARHYVLLSFNPADIKEEQLLFDLAKFNFNKFLIKDFDLSFKTVNQKQRLLIINGFNGATEAAAYINTLKGDSEMREKLSQFENYKMVISDANLRVILTQPNLTSYLLFYSQNYTQVK